MTKPLNEHLLWKGTIQKANYSKSVRKSPMLVPEVNWLTGEYYVGQSDNISSELRQSYSYYSRNYWNCVKARAQEYRRQRS
jgi:hypothetical protein